MNLRRTWVVAANVFQEVIRDRILYMIAIFGVLLGLAILLIPDLALGAGDKIVLDLGLAGINLIGLIVAVFVGTGLVNREIDKRTVFVLIAKPMQRSEFIFGKHLGLTAVLAVLVGAMALLYILGLNVGHITYPLVPLLVAIGFILLQLSLITAVSILFGVATSSVLAILLTLAIYVLGHLSRELVALGKIAHDPFLQQVSDGLFLVLPDLERLNLNNEAVYGLLPSWTALGGDILYGLLYTVVLLGLAVIIFSQREF